MSVADRVERVRGLISLGFGPDGAQARLATQYAASLERAVGQLASSLGDDTSPTFRRWMEAIAQFGQLEVDRQDVELARGLRLCREIAGAPPRLSRRPRQSSAAIDAPLDSLPGIGPKSAVLLAERNLHSIRDLLFFVPRRYDDARRARSLASLGDADVGERVTLRTCVESVSFVRRGQRRWLDVRFKEEGKGLIIRFFGAFPSARDRYPVGTWVTLAATVSQRAGSFEMTNPDVLAIGADEAATEPRVIPRYRVIAGVPGKRLEKAIGIALDRCVHELSDAVPVSVREAVSIHSLSEALTFLHRPIATDDPCDLERLNSGKTAWHRRLAFEEMFVLAAQIARRRAERRSGDALACNSELGANRAIAALGFELTTAQARVGAQIAADLAVARPMNRLLQGDVGCGKTAVAFIAAARAADSGAQVALMAPTELLAEQHFHNLAPLAKSIGLRVTLLTGSVPAAAKRSVVALLGAHKIDIAIGTHALLAESVLFANLGLVIIDEQHRFGVAQRVRLRRKGLSPHMLVMTATPIPRSLALSVYGDLDVSVIDELPAGRVPTKTLVMRGDPARRKTYRALLKRIEKGEQAYVVCPLVEPSEVELGRPWRSATEVWGELKNALAPHSVGLVHGRLSADERAESMRRFRSGEIRVLVATTVIEVGVDVPTATVIIIEDADHFGLAQLHQLRGRVGRGQLPGQCALLCRGRTSNDASARLEIMAETTDGFRIAEKDLEIRGPGELLGARQAGLPNLRFGDLREHVELLALAREHAFSILENDPTLANPAHQGLVTALARETFASEAFDAESG